MTVSGPPCTVLVPLLARSGNIAKAVLSPGYLHWSVPEAVRHGSCIIMIPGHRPVQLICGFLHPTDCMARCVWGYVVAHEGSDPSFPASICYDASYWEHDPRQPM